MRFRQIGLEQVRAGKVCVDEFGPREFGPPELGADETRAFEIGAGHFRAYEHGEIEIAVGQVCLVGTLDFPVFRQDGATAKIGIVEVGIVELCVLQDGAT